MLKLHKCVTMFGRVVVERIFSSCECKTEKVVNFLGSILVLHVLGCLYVCVCVCVCVCVREGGTNGVRHYICYYY